MSTSQELRSLLHQRVLQLGALAFLFAFVVWRSLSLKLAVRDLDNWWHVRVGQWILSNHSFPHTGIFSDTAATRPWAAYSWGYEVLLAVAYKVDDIVGMAVFGTILTVLVAASVYVMARRLSGHFWAGCLVAAVACSVFLFSMCPRPAYLSMILFAVELTLILEAKRRGRVQLLYWLPLIFVFWANFHIQFIYGIGVIGLFFVVNLGQRTAASAGWEPEWLAPASLPTANVATAFVGCLVATCIGPYSYHLYGIVADYAGAKLPYQLVQEMQPLTFRAPSHYLQVLLTGAAFFALGRSRRIDAFKLALMIVAAVMGFRMMRDAWFLCIAAAACLADAPRHESDREPMETWYQFAGIAAFLVAAGFLFAPNTGFSRAGLDAVISNSFPVDAANYLRKHPHSGPLYNSFDWGGFLIWYMPDRPVSIDGRTDLYGDELGRRFLSTSDGDPSYLTDPYLNQAGVVLLQRELPLATILERDPRFTKIYEDRIATMFVRGAE